MRLRPPDKAPTRRDGEKRYKQVLGHSLSCLSATAFWHSAPAPKGPRDTLVLFMVPDDPLVLTREHGDKLLLSATQDFRLEERDGQWRCPTLAYTYTISIESDDDGLKELLSWQWRSGSGRGPHVHVSASQPSLAPTLRLLHIPTGRVAFEDVVRFLIEDLKVEAACSDWPERLEDAEYYFRTHRSWPGPHPAPKP